MNTPWPVVRLFRFGVDSLLLIEWTKREGMNLLVTGGYGFIGSAFVRYLIEKTEHRILNVDCLTYAANRDNLAMFAGNPRHRWIRQDLSEREGLSAVFKAEQPDAVIHLAAESHVDRSIASPDNFLRSNVIGTYHLLEVARAHWEKLPPERRERFRFLHVSSDEVYGDLGDSGGAFSETTPYAPGSPYSASKAASDHFVRAWGRTFGMPVLLANSSNNFGPFQFPEKLIPRMIIRALSGESLPVYGDGRQVRDWLYVEDHAEALYRVFERGAAGETYNIGAGNERSNIDVVRQICALLEELAPDRKRKRRGAYADLITFVADRPGHDRRYAINPAKIRETLEWHPRETFNAGLRRTVRWYLDHPQWWRRLLSGSPRAGAPDKKSFV